MASNSQEWENYGNQKKGCYRVLDNGTYIYNGYVLMDKRGVRPSEAFVYPSLQQFEQLYNYLGGGQEFDSKGALAMISYNIEIEDMMTDEIEISKGNNSSGFNAKKGGYAYDNGYGSTGNCSYWWTSTVENNEIVGFSIGYCSQDMPLARYSPKFGFAIRLIKQ